MSETFDRQPALRDLLGLIEMMLSRNSSIAGRSPHPRELKERPAIFDARMNCPDKEPASPAPSVKVCAWVTPVPSSFAPHGVVEEFPAARVANLKAPGVPLRRLAFEL